MSGLQCEFTTSVSTWGFHGVCVGTRHPSEFSSLNSACQMLQMHIHWHSTMAILWHIVCLSSTCMQSWTHTVHVRRSLKLDVSSPLAYTHPCCQQKTLSFSGPMESHNTTQCSSLYTAAITQYKLTLAMSISPSAHSRWRQQPNYSKHDLSMKHELHQNFSQVLIIYGKYESFLMGTHFIQERPVGEVSRDCP